VACNAYGLDGFERHNEKSVVRTLANAAIELSLITEDSALAAIHSVTAVPVVCPRCQRLIWAYQLHSTSVPPTYFRKCPACGFEWKDNPPAAASPKKHDRKSHKGQRPRTRRKN